MEKVKCSNCGNEREDRIKMSGIDTQSNKGIYHCQDCGSNFMGEKTFDTTELKIEKKARMPTPLERLEAVELVLADIVKRLEVLEK